MKAFYNDEMMDLSSVSIDPNDLVVQRGYGIFDFFRIVDHKPLFLNDHLDRFIRSADKARLPLRWSKEILHERIQQLIKVNGLAEGGIKLLLTGGISPMGFEIEKPNLVITQNQAKCPDDLAYLNGSKLITHEYLRDLPEIKTTNYFTSVWLYPEMKKQKAMDVLYHRDGNILELSRSNVFLVINDVLVTPRDEMLQGITRSKVLKFAPKFLPVEVRIVTIDELKNATEVFITSTLKKIMPIVTVDGETVGNGEVGKFTQLLMKKFESYSKEYLLVN